LTYGYLDWRSACVVVVGTAAEKSRWRLADDEPMVCNVMAEVLESLGYRVLKAADGLEAME